MFISDDVYQFDKHYCFAYIMKNNKKNRANYIVNYKITIFHPIFVEKKTKTKMDEKKQSKRGHKLE